MKRILVLGGTGAIGRHTVRALLDEGYTVDVVALDQPRSDDPRLTYTVGNAMDIGYIRRLLTQTHYDGIIDYMIYHTAQFAERFELFLENTDHYVYLSSYRIYADDTVITEQSPRLLDVSTDEEFLKTEDYSLYKARCENILRASKYKNWTITRPTITYSELRYQLVTLEADYFIPRALAGKTILLPREAMEVEAAMTYAGDAGRMFAKLMLNPKAYGETFTIGTAEHHPWKYVAECYTDLLGAKIEWIDREDFLRIRSGGKEINPAAAYQLDYDRLFNRAIDNRKVLEATGLSQADFMPLKEGLKRVLNAVDLTAQSWRPLTEFHQAMDDYLKGE